MYTTDLQGLFGLLSGSEQSGTLILQPDTQMPVWQARFTLDRGQLTACVVIASKREPVELEPIKAIADLSKQGALRWTLEPPSSEHELHLPSVRPESTLSRQGSVIASEKQGQWHAADRPCRMKIALHPAVEWKRLHRSTFALIDGNRTIKEIAQMLHKSLDDILPILHDLYQTGWIGKL